MACADAVRGGIYILNVRKGAAEFCVSRAFGVSQSRDGDFEFGWGNTLENALVGVDALMHVLVGVNTHEHALANGNTLTHALLC